MSNTPLNVPQILRMMSGLIPNQPDPGVGSEDYWEKAYDSIFGGGICRSLNQWASTVGITIEWCDPDTTYREDVCAYADAVLEVQEELLGAYYKSKKDVGIDQDQINLGAKGLNTLAELSEKMNLPPGEVLAKAISLLDLAVTATRNGLTVGIAPSDEHLTTVFRGLDSV